MVSVTYDKLFLFITFVRFQSSAATFYKPFLLAAVPVGEACTSHHT